MDRIGRNWQVLSIIVLALIGVTVVMYSMKWSPWAFTDSVAYVEAARNLATGKGLVLEQASGDVIPLSLHAPLYPTLLAIFNLVGFNMYFGAKLLNAFFFLIFILSICLAIYSLSKQLWLTILTGIVLVSHPILLQNFTGIMTEGAYLAVSSLSFVFLFQFFQKEQLWLFVGSVIFAALSLLSRFAGGVVIASAAGSILIFYGRRFYRRVIAALSYLIVSVLPFVVWTVSVARLGGNPRTFSLVQPSLWAKLAPTRIAIVSQIWDWLPLGGSAVNYGYRTRLFGIMSITLAVFVLAVYVYIRWQSGGMNEMESRIFQSGTIPFLFTVAYLVFIFASYSFSSHLYEAPNERMLSPLFVSALVGCALLILVVFLLLKKHRLYLVLSSIFGLALIWHQFPSSASFIKQMRESGLGYTSETWLNSQVIPAVAELPEDTILISNDIDAIMFFTHRPAYRIPELDLRIRKDDFLAFGQESEDGIQRIFRDEGAALILFDAANWQFADLYGAKGQARIESFTEGLHLFGTFHDGNIYYFEG